MKSEWGRRAAELYDAAYAQRYRTVDDRIHCEALVTHFGQWLAGVCDSFGRPISVLDLGCGTGRYFWALRHTRELTGIDVSAPMLAEARRPVAAAAVSVGALHLINGDFLTADFANERFDLVYSIGVLGEHVPFDVTIVERVNRWLVPGGRFAFTAVHRESFSIPRTAQRRLAERAMVVAPSVVAEPLRQRLLAGGLYTDERYLRDVLTASGLGVESISRYESDVHLHCLCVARKSEGPTVT